MFPYQFIYLVVAVIVIIGIGVLGIMLIRRGRRARDEGLFAPPPDETAEAGPRGTRVQPESAAPFMSEVYVADWEAAAGGAPESGGSEAAPAEEPAAPAQAASAPVAPAAAPVAAAPIMPAPAAAAAPAEPVSPPAPEPDYLQGVDQLLSEWRTKHELAAAAPSAQAPAPEAPEAPAAHAAETPEAGAEAPAGPDAFESHTGGARVTAPAGQGDAPPNAPWGAAPPTPWGAAPHAQSLADPLGMVIVDMLDGMGKLTGAELKRLDVFRPERIDLAVQTLQLPLRLQNDEDAAMRLAQIQLYAATLELRAKWAAQMRRSAAGTTDVPYSARDFKLKIARDIMDLPVPDRAEVIGFLLGGLLGSPGSTPQLKRAVIDTLEHLRSAALINVLLDCLDDPDPIVQEYALAAAERVLDD